MTICTTFEFALLLRSQCAVAVHVLIIGHEPDGTPTAAVCSLCGEWMAENASAGLSSRDTIVFFTAQFKVHAKENHPQFLPN